MSNPFAALDVYDEEDQAYIKKQDKGKKVQQVKKVEKPQNQKIGTFQNQNTTQNMPTRIRDDATTIRNKREARPPKDLPQGHTHDRRSGTGRVDKPRKQGGGRGGMGNLHDQQIKDKYFKEGQEVKQQTEEQKPEEPQGITLQEYYRNKGVDLQSLNQTKKQPVKIGEINAEWIKKEKLTVMETKQQKKYNERNEVQIVKRKNHADHDQQSKLQNLGFTSKADKPKRQRQEQAPKQTDNKKYNPKEKKKQKVAINEADFPSL